jgi:hypothetical protein
MLASIANVGKNICYLLSSASRASINMRFAKRNNMGDISGKSVSQFTTSSLIGMGLGMALTSAINISNIFQLIPTCLALSTVSITATYYSAAIIDEIYLNNQRAKLIFDLYLEKGIIPDVEKVNAAEIFHLPNFLNFKRCSYVKFGEREISQVLT